MEPIDEYHKISMELLEWLKHEIDGFKVWMNTEIGKLEDALREMDSTGSN